MKVIPEKHYNIPDEGYPRKTLQYTRRRLSQKNITINLMKVIPEKHYNIPDEVIPEKHYNIPVEGYPRKTLQYT
jgi:hypothetical protein